MIFPLILHHVVSIKSIIFYFFRYQQEVETPFHVSKACLEPNTGKPGEVTSVFVEVDDEEFIVCNLNGKNMNENLDLNFNTGDKVCFKTNVNIYFFISV